MEKKIIVIKIGSSILVTRHRRFDQFRSYALAGQINRLRAVGFQIVLVISGAVALGNKIIADRQAAAGIGQVILMSSFYEAFRRQKIAIAQILVQRDDLDKSNIKLLMFHYLEKNIVPVFNENDVLELNGFGGNDLLAGKITELICADKLIIVSSWKTLGFGVGGGSTKLQVTERLKEKGIITQIIEGKEKDCLVRNLL